VTLCFFFLPARVRSFLGNLGSFLLGQFLGASLTALNSTLPLPLSADIEPTIVLTRSYARYHVGKLVGVSGSFGFVCHIDKIGANLIRCKSKLHEVIFQTDPLPESY